VLFRKIFGYRVKVRDGIADRFLIGDPQHAQIHFLDQLGRVGGSAHPAAKGLLQRRSALAEESLDERWTGLGHHAPEDVPGSLYMSESLQNGNRNFSGGWSDGLGQTTVSNSGRGSLKTSWQSARQRGAPQPNGPYG
jgi:hypothetical protein